MEITSSSQRQTQKIAKDLAKNLKKGDVIALYGDLGAGKTIFVKGLAQGLGIKKRITSPTFIFIKSYRMTDNLFHHVDLYRGQEINDFKSLGLDEIFSGDAIVAIEWADRIKKGIPKNRIDVRIETTGENKRRIKII